MDIIYFGDVKTRSMIIAQHSQWLLDRLNNSKASDHIKMIEGEKIVERQKFALEQLRKGIDKFYGNRNKYKPRKDTPKSKRTS